MDIFVKKYQPELYEFWRLGIDNQVSGSSSGTRLHAGGAKSKHNNNQQRVDSYLSKIADKYDIDDDGDDEMDSCMVNSNHLVWWTRMPARLKRALSRQYESGSLANMSLVEALRALKKSDASRSEDQTRASLGEDENDSVSTTYSDLDENDDQMSFEQVGGETTGPENNKLSQLDYADCERCKIS